MDYDKPEVVVLGSALLAVQSGMKICPNPLDNIHQCTNGAYEADE